MQLWRSLRAHRRFQRTLRRRICSLRDSFLCLLSVATKSCNLTVSPALEWEVGAKVLPHRTLRRFPAPSGHCSSVGTLGRKHYAFVTGATDRLPGLTDIGCTSAYARRMAPLRRRSLAGW